MIPVEQYAARTARLAELAANLVTLDQAWTALDAKFAPLAVNIAQKHQAGVTAGQDLVRLSALSAALLQMEQTAIEQINSALLAVQEFANG